MSVDRRKFVQTVGGAGVFAALARPGEGQTGRGGDDFEKPAGLRPGAQLDSRFPVSFARPVAEGFRLMTEYFTALSQRDVPAFSAPCTFRSRSTKASNPSSSTSAAD